MEKIYKSIESFTEENRPTSWIIEGLDESLAEWKEKIAKEFNIKSEYAITIQYGFDSETCILNLSGTGRTISPEEEYIAKLEEIIERECYEELKPEEDISHFLSHQSCTDLKKYLWLFYKTADIRLFFDNDGEFFIFLEIGNIKLIFRS